MWFKDQDHLLFKIQRHRGVSGFSLQLSFQAAYLGVVACPPTELRITPQTELGDNASIKSPPVLSTTPFPNRRKRARRATAVEGAEEPIKGEVGNA